MENAQGGSALSVAQKRRYSQSEPIPVDATLQHSTDCCQAKQRKKDSSQLMQMEFNLISLCDELLYEIFKYLDSWSLLAVMNCSPRFESFLLDHRFWHNIDLSNGPLPMGILEDILGRATEKTHTIKICGPPSSQHVAGEFKQFTCTLTSVFPKVSTHLQVLELQGVSLDFEYIHISEFPSSLKSLKLKDCSVRVGDQDKSIFHTIEKQLVDLEELGIEDNNWFKPYYILSLSKLPSLRRLSLRGCELMCKFVPYFSMASRFGFPKLEALDLRLTPINNSDLQCFSAIETLRELLLESPTIRQRETPSPDKTTSNGSDGDTASDHGNGNCNANDEAASSVKPESQSGGDDEPSTSRAALENLRSRNNNNNSDNNNTDDAQPRIDKVGHLELNKAGGNEATINNQRNDSSDADDSDSSDTEDAPGAPSHSQPPLVIRLPREAGGMANGNVNVNANANPNPHGNANGNVNVNLNGEGVRGDRQARSPVVVIAMPRFSLQNHPPLPPCTGRPQHRAYVLVDDEEQAAADEERAEQRAEEPGEEREGGDHNRAMLENLAQYMRSAAHFYRGNQPAHSRFLPRRDQVIHLNPPTERNQLLSMATRRLRTQQRGNMELVVQHPMFWNMMDPLDRDYSRRVRSRMVNPMQPQDYVSDRAIYSFGRATNPVQPDIIWIRHINRSPNNRLERIVLRNYHHITNHTLEHLVQCSPNLVYIDISGTSITLAGVRNFKKQKPHCDVIAEHLDGSVEESTVPQLDDPKNGGGDDDNGNNNNDDTNTSDEKPSTSSAQPIPIPPTPPPPPPPPPAQH